MNAVLQYLDSSDRRLSGRVATWDLPRWVGAWMRWSTHLGDGWLWVAVGLMLAAGGPRTWPAFGAAALSAAAANTAVVLLKGRVRRARPSARPGNCFFAGRADRWAFDEFSFPSGHALNAFALTATVGLALHALAVPLLVLAVSIALSRVVLGVHFVADVVAGALIGATLGTLAFRLVLG
jgi:undecaprenyl-diphosphatase